MFIDAGQPVPWDLVPSRLQWPLNLECRHQGQRHPDAWVPGGGVHVQHREAPLHLCLWGVGGGGAATWGHRHTLAGGPSPGRPGQAELQSENPP